MLQDLTAEFPDSDWISATAALAQYNLRNFDEAQELYEDLLERDPHRIDVSAPSHMNLFGGVAQALCCERAKAPRSSSLDAFWKLLLRCTRKLFLPLEAWWFLRCWTVHHVSQCIFH